jgi:NhaP-type Na+/H+ or K+/H+ antiporter
MNFLYAVLTGVLILLMVKTLEFILLKHYQKKLQFAAYYQSRARLEKQQDIVFALVNFVGLALVIEVPTIIFFNAFYILGLCLILGIFVLKMLTAFLARIYWRKYIAPKEKEQLASKVRNWMKHP